MRGQFRSDAVSLTVHSALTSTYIPHQLRYSNVCVVRDEEAAGSNPATPTSSEGMQFRRTGVSPGDREQGRASSLHPDALPRGVPYREMQ